MTFSLELWRLEPQNISRSKVSTFYPKFPYSAVPLSDSTSWWEIGQDIGCCITHTHTCTHRQGVVTVTHLPTHYSRLTTLTQVTGPLECPADVQYMISPTFVSLRKVLIRTNPPWISILILFTTFAITTYNTFKVQIM